MRRTSASAAVRECPTVPAVMPDLVSARGWGDANSVASNDTAQGRVQNRRVELTLAAAPAG